MGKWTRREFLRLGGVTAAVGGLVLVDPASASASLAAPAPPTTPGLVTGSVTATTTDGFLAGYQRATLAAAVSRIVPSSGPGDWSAADLGVVDYIDGLLSGFDADPSTGRIYPGGPYRNSSPAGPGFFKFQPLTRIKAIGWRRQVQGWKDIYTAGLAGLDSAAEGDFAAAPALQQDLVLLAMDLEGSPFFAVLFNHTMEGTYAHPVYGGNQGYRAWQWLGFGGDVHGIRFPTTASRGSWNVYGGYAPEEIIQPGSASTEQPVVTPVPAGRA